jgi:DNA-directed RNA polymerase III subunit RPC1
MYFRLCSARFIGNHGFSIGVDDVQPGEHLNQEKKKKVDGGYTQCHDLISSFSKGALTLLPGCNAAQTLEAEITKILNDIRKEAGDVSSRQFSCSCVFPLPICMEI